MSSSLAVPSAPTQVRATTEAVAAKVSGYGDRPGFKADAVVATQATHALSQRLNHLHQIDALQRADSLIGVTLNVTEALGGMLEEMKGLALRLQ